MNQSRIALLVFVLCGCWAGAGCAPSVTCPTGTRLKKQKRHSGEHTRISHLCLETERVTFLKGKRHGAATYHDARRKLLRRGQWATGVRHGRWTYYMPSGGIQRDEPWSKGAKHGLVRYYDGSGRLVRRTCNYIQGSPEPCKDLAQPVPPRPRP